MAAITAMVAVAWAPYLNVPFGDNHLGRIIGRYAVDAGEEQWVVGDQKVGAPGEGLLHHHADRVDREEDLAYGALRLAAPPRCCLG